MNGGTSSGGSGCVFMVRRKALKGIGNAAGRQTIADTARGRGAGEDAMSALEALPRRRFQTPAQISRAVSQEEG